MEENVKKYLTDNEYPGRVIIIGKNDKDFPVIIYAIMGRTENSQNRFFEHDDEIIKTAPIDKTKVKDAELIIYTALTKVELENEIAAFVVTNGRQTDALAQELKTTSFQDILKKWKHEPDAPNYTSRISGVIYVGRNISPQFSLFIIKANPTDPEHASTYEFFEKLPVVTGMGFGISTYAGNGDPLPQFKGEPFQVSITGDATQIAQKYWDTLNPKYRVALFAKVIDPVSFASSISIIDRQGIQH